MDCALDLMRRLPPQKIEKHLSDLIDLVPSLCEDLLSSVDQPLKIIRDKQVGKDFLLCDYNRDGDSYRYIYLNVDIFQVIKLKTFHISIDHPGAIHIFHHWTMVPYLQKNYENLK